MLSGTKNESIEPLIGGIDTFFILVEEFEKFSIEPLIGGLIRYNLVCTRYDATIEPLIGGLIRRTCYRRAVQCCNHY